MQFSFAPHWTLVKQIANSWLDDYLPSMGAALAFYTLFSLAPLLLIVISVAGLVFGEVAARGEITAQLGSLMGERGANAVQDLLSSVARPAEGAFATALGLVLMFIGATTVFGELQDSLDRIWRVPARARTGGWFSLVRSRLLSFGMILAIGFLLIVSLVVSTALASTGRWLEPVFAAGSGALATATPAAAASFMRWVLMAVSALIALGGLAVAYWAFVRNTDVPRQVRESLGWAFTLAEKKYFVDDAYNALVGYIWDFGRWLARIIDQRGIDGAVNGVAGITGWAGGQIRRLQTGLLGLYALSILFGAVALVVWFVIK